MIYPTMQVATQVHSLIRDLPTLIGPHRIARSFNTLHETNMSRTTTPRSS